MVQRVGASRDLRLVKLLKHSVINGIATRMLGPTWAHRVEQAWYLTAVRTGVPPPRKWTVGAPKIQRAHLCQNLVPYSL